MKPIIKLTNISKSFDDNLVLDNLNLVINEGTLTAITGRSGSGKSTLLNIIGTIEKPSSGTLEICGKTNVRPNSKASMLILRSDLSYLFQNYALIDNASVMDNLKIAQKYIEQPTVSIEEALDIVGLLGFEDKKIYKLSGGEQQRVALARTLIKPGSIILADEPTGNVDYDNKINIIEIFRTMKSMGKTIIVVTHDKDILGYFDEVIHLG
jgi:putative ABC transport system ATP-binding protein